MSLDASSSVRAGEELPVKQLSAYLTENLPDIAGPIVVEQFPSGFSNLTYLLRAGDRELVLRRPPLGASVKTAHDMGREYRILTHLYPVYRKVPRPLLFCEDEKVIGAPFYLMERVKGVILRAYQPSGIDLTPALMARLSEAFVLNFAEIHQFDYENSGLGDLGRPQGYVKRQVDGWTKRYFNARTDEVASIERLASWLAENLPDDRGRAALIHNDYKYDNLVLSPEDPAQVIAVLDWEMATIGDPLMDFGTSLAYWVEKSDPEDWQRYGFGMTSLPGSLTRAELVEHYVARTGCQLDDPVFYFAYGLLKVAGIVQQIYFRYQQGLTRDPRFAGLGALVRACGDLAVRAIERKRIDRLG